MRKGTVQKVIVHSGTEEDRLALAKRVSEFYAAVIERRLCQSGLPASAQIEAVSQIVKKLREQERELPEKGSGDT